MDSILNAGLDFIVQIQALGTPGTDRFFDVFTKFGARGYMLLIPLVLWCIDYRLGMRVTLAMATTLYINTTLKGWIGLDRPFLVDDRIVSAGEDGFAMPSGHAQLVVVYWGLLAHWVSRRGFWALALLIMFGMGLSRVYLGVHYPTDVIVGWGIGALTVWAFIACETGVLQRLNTLSFAHFVLGVIGVGLGAVAFDAAAVGDHTFLNPGVAGFVVGSVLGGLWTTHRGTFDTKGPVWQRGLRLVLGLIIGMGLMALLQAIGVPENDLAKRYVVAIDLAVVGIWMTGLMPWVFEKARLSSMPDDLGEAY